MVGKLLHNTEKHEKETLCSVFLTGWGDSHHQPEICSVPPPLLPSPPKVNSTQQKIINVIFSCSHPSCTIFVLISCSFQTQIMLILILIDAQYSQNAVFSFEKFWNRQNHSSSGSYHLVRNSPQQCSLLFDTKSGKRLKF